jgi:hypothetical protein
MANGSNLVSSKYFPKVTHCDFKIRELGSDHLYTVIIFILESWSNICFLFKFFINNVSSRFNVCYQ